MRSEQILYNTFSQSCFICHVYYCYMLNFIWFCPFQNNLQYVNQGNRNVPILIASPYIPLKQKIKHPYQFLDFALSRLSARIFIDSLFESSRKSDALAVNTISAMVLLSNCNFLGQFSIATSLFRERSL